MRFSAALLMTVLAAPAVWAQLPTASPTGYGRILFPGGGSGAAGIPNTSGGGAGRILFPGTGAPAVSRLSSNANTGFPVVGNPLPPQVQHRNHSNPVIIPYPVYYGGGYYNYDAPQAQLASNAIPVAYAAAGIPQQADPSPVVIINQYFRADGTVTSDNPVSRATAVDAGPQPYANNNDAPVFIIAMKDHTIMAASAYWVEDGTLNYITIQGSQNSASMDLVDRDLSRRLNKDRNVAFGLPNN
ncbi:MAG: hypothetical protein ABI995_00145 [Acidobacteriota bacterium]